MSNRSRLAMVIAAVLLVFAAAACSGSSPRSATDIARANSCAVLVNFGDSLAQFQGVDIASIGVENLAPQINNVVMSWNTVKTTLAAFAAAQPEPAETEKLATLESAWSDLEAALGAISTDAPTQESIDAAKAAAGEVRTACTAALGELDCVASSPAS